MASVLRCRDFPARCERASASASAARAAQRMAAFKPTYDKVYRAQHDYAYAPPPPHGTLEGALLKRKEKNLLKDARWKRYWVVADGATLRYFRNERSDDDELRRLKPRNGVHARKRVPLARCRVAVTQGGRPGFEVCVADEANYTMCPSAYNSRSARRRGGVRTSKRRRRGESQP